MSFSFIKNLEGKELTDEKIRDFKRLIIAQCGIIASILLLELSETFHWPGHPAAVEFFFFGVLGVYVFLLWDALRNYTRNRMIITINFIFIIGVFVLASLVANPLYDVILKTGSLYKLLLTFTQVSLLLVEGFVTYFTVVEFFKKEFNLPIKLWAAACIYLMTGLAFGSMYEIICLQDLDCLGMEIPIRTLALMKRMGYSLMVLSGADSPYTATSLIHMMGTIEALWGQLFVVLIVGRLLVK